MSGKRSVQADNSEGTVGPLDNEVEIVDIYKAHPRRPLPPKKRELIKKVRGAGSLLCPGCSREMHIDALIDGRAVIVRILRHHGLWEENVRINPAGEGRSGEVVPRRSSSRL